MHAGVITEPGDTPMKTIRTALLSLLAVAALLPACADEAHTPGPSAAPDEEQLGTLALSLETTAASGTRYRLRQAVFLVDRSNLSGILGGLFGGIGGIGGTTDAGSGFAGGFAG